MTHLVLLSHHLNAAYIQNVPCDTVTIAVTKAQFETHRYHKKRIVYHLAAAFHFASEHDIPILYEPTWADVLNNLPSDDEFIVYEPVEWSMKQDVWDAFMADGRHLTMRPDLNFMVDDILMELGDPPFKLDPLYRRWRHRFNILIENGKPVGGKYSFDAANRNRPPKTLDVREPLMFPADAITTDVIRMVEDDFRNHPGEAGDFQYPVTRDDALLLLDHFIAYRLERFGTYQDAMMEDRPFMVHSLLSAAINLGLLSAEEVVRDVEQAYHNGAPLEAVEGFIRQILGWREYIRGVYLRMGKDYKQNNALGHHQPLPGWFYDADVDLNCLNTTISETIGNGYNHHIQRLMIIGNLANLIGVRPLEVNNWFNEMYIDSFDWVVTPNVIGMALYADGGVMSTKPYISSAAYINRMSNYCKSCKYDPTKRTGANACPVNALFYHFLDRHRERLASNPRMTYMYANLNKLDENTRDELVDYARQFIRKQ